MEFISHWKSNCVKFEVFTKLIIEPCRTQKHGLLFYFICFTRNRPYLYMWSQTWVKSLLLWFPGDSLSEHNGAMFSTPSRDNDRDAVNCASKYASGWWFTGCFKVHLNAPYGQYPTVPSYKGIMWKSSWGTTKFAKFVTMMVRPNF